MFYPSRRIPLTGGRMRQQSITVTILYYDEDRADDYALVSLDKMGDWMIDRPGVVMFDKEFHAPKNANASDVMWEDYFNPWDGEK
jgi:hypothetical protein